MDRYIGSYRMQVLVVFAQYLQHEKRKEKKNHK
jgi:hypothetical protein